MLTAPDLDHAALCALIPHAGSMCLLDTVLDWDGDRIRCRTNGHRAPGHPLRRADGTLGASHLLEYGAQAAAVHGALLAALGNASARPGYLVTTRRLALYVPRLDDLPDALEINANRLLGGASGWVYEFSVTHTGQCLAEGQFTIAQREANHTGAAL